MASLWKLTEAYRYRYYIYIYIYIYIERERVNRVIRATSSCCASSMIQDVLLASSAYKVTGLSSVWTYGDQRVIRAIISAHMLYVTPLSGSHSLSWASPGWPPITQFGSYALSPMIDRLHSDLGPGPPPAVAQQPSELSGLSCYHRVIGVIMRHPLQLSNLEWKLLELWEKNFWAKRERKTHTHRYIYTQIYSYDW